jgi:PPOX class probable F420-dependent enzyme
VTIEFNEATRRLLDGRNFATIATVSRDGAPQASVVWILRDGDTVLFSSMAGRQKVRNLARDPRISISIFDSENPYSSAEIRGHAVLVEDTTGSLPRELSHKYLGEDPPGDPDGTVRMVVRVIPDKVVLFSA